MSATYVDLIKPRAGGHSQRDGRKWGNGRHRARTDYPADSGAPLSRHQKAKLCIRAKAAFTEIFGGGDTAAVEAWRREQQHAITGHHSLTTCTQQHYLPLLAHFADLAGESGEAMTAHMKDATAAKRIAMHKLAGELDARGLPLAWAAAICRSKFKCAVEEATAKQLWKLVFDVRHSKHAVVKSGKQKPETGQAETPF